VGEPPTGKEKQRPYKSKEAREKIKHKIDTVVRRGYMVLVMAKMLLSLMDMFDVPKGANDIRLVYNGSKSGLNESFWAPWFCLSTVDMMCRTLFPNSWCDDNDYGEMFLNFKMH
jgi:hypothetical protein